MISSLEIDPVEQLSSCRRPDQVVDLPTSDNAILFKMMGRRIRSRSRWEVGSGVPVYVFLLINHLGEPFAARELDFDDDRKALDHAETLAGRDYPVEVRSGGQLLGLIPMIPWEVEDWLKPHLGPWPLD
jgi:hypothetical protein